MYGRCVSCLLESILHYISEGIKWYFHIKKMDLAKFADFFHTPVSFLRKRKEASP